MKVLFPIDDSPHAEATLNWAANFLNKDATEVYLLNVVYNSPDALVQEWETEAAQTLLDKARQSMQERGFNVIEAQYVLGSPSQAICDYADEKGIDQIIIGSHGRTGLAKMLLGSVSEGVFKNARQPVFILNNRQNASLEVSHPEQITLQKQQH